ncbi:MAG TPA: PD-(D/E)XK nuclease family protein [Burkholderiaceae bacterium]|nr:PD-(D/E)XK nuclease family protein [Burkholderiaceae bacterium]
MTTIVSHVLAPGVRPADMWRAVAQTTHAWFDEQQIVAADAVVLLPFADLLAPARRAFAERSVSMPRVHTVRTLAAALGPPVTRTAGELTGDGSIDRVTARELLRKQAWAREWRQRDAHGFDAALQRLVYTAHALRKHADAMVPDERAPWFARARKQVGAGSGPGSTQRLLLRLAIEWAALAGAADTDRLFAHRPSAWVELTLGGADAFAGCLLRQASDRAVPALSLSVDPVAADPFEAWPERCTLTIEAADDAEGEAMSAAAQVTRFLRDGATPIALVAQDRALVRRVRALLERSQIGVIDETGWSMATTRAGAHATAALRAARAVDASDDALDWLKADLDEPQADVLATLEKVWRGQRVSGVARDRADALWQHERARLDAFARPRRRALGDWLQAFDVLLYGSPHGAVRRDDDAGVQLRRALRMDDAVRADDAAWLAARASTCTLEEFSQWVEVTLEQASYVPSAESAAAAVVITPLSRAIGRDFAAAVLPGSDELRLGTLPNDPGLLDEASRKALGLPDRVARQRRAVMAFAHLLRLPRVAVLHRRADGDELLPISPWVERSRLARQRRGVAPPQSTMAPMDQRTVRASPVSHPHPVPGAALPASWSASQVEALRQCPYRFFSRAVLQLSEADELDDDADKRDAGRWLHSTLERFHVARGPQRRALVDDTAALLLAGHDMLAELVQSHQVSEEAMLPFTATWPALAARYVHWLHEEEAKGWLFDAAEVRIDMPQPEGATLRLHGRIDRIDRGLDGAAVRLIDYKTNSRDALRSKVRQPLEDTQLAVYAALQSARDHGRHEVRASYLALDDDEAVCEVEHPDVLSSAQRLVQELSLERKRIEAGAPLLALGESPVCDICEARGLCRRDHWAEPDEEADGAR